MNLGESPKLGEDLKIGVEQMVAIHDHPPGRLTEKHLFCSLPPSWKGTSAGKIELAFAQDPHLLRLHGGLFHPHHPTLERRSSLEGARREATRRESYQAEVGLEVSRLRVMSGRFWW